jgi:malonyl-CoA O-methyltransferase
LKIQEAYDAWAATYDRDRNATRDLDAKVLRKSLAGRRADCALELGCGTGKNTAFLARIARKVYALDFSRAMVLEAKAKLPHAKVDFAYADLTKRWPRAEASVDLVVCDLVLEHIKDLPQIFSQAWRTLTPGGTFFICELHPSRQYQGKKANFQRGGKAVAIPSFIHHISDFIKASVDSGFSLEDLREWWGQEDENKPPRLISFEFKKPAY